MSISDPVTWVMRPGTLALSAADPAGTTYGLGIAPDSHFQVHRREPGSPLAVTDHDTLADALAVLPVSVADFLQEHGRIMVDGAVEVHAGRFGPVPPAGPRPT